MPTTLFATLLTHPINATPQASVTDWWPHYLQVCRAAERWQRDRAVFAIAATARAARFARACANAGFVDGQSR